MNILINKEIPPEQQSRFFNKESTPMVQISPFKALFSRNSHQDGKESFYIYQIEADKKQYRALIGTVSFASIKTKQVLPHEETCYERKLSLQAMFSTELIQHNPILLLTDDEIFSEIKEPIVSQVESIDEHIDQSGTMHRLYRSCLEHKGFFLPSTLCIADGHHRIHALLDHHQKRQNCLNTSRMMVAISSISDISNRAKGIIVNLDKTPLCDLQFFQLLSKLQIYFTITKISIGHVPTSPFDFCMSYQNIWYQLRLKLRWISSSLCDFLSIEVFREFILRKIFCVNTYTSQNCVEVNFDACNILSLRSSAHNQRLLGFILAADPTAKILKAAREGRILEPNSTYFEPKFFSGMISHFL